MSDPKFNKTFARSIILGLGTFVVAFIVFKMLSKKSDSSEIKISFRSKVVEVQSFIPSTIPLKIVVNGRLKASDRMEIFSEVNGILQNRNFRTGTTFAAGQVIASMDQSEFLSQLKAQKSSFMGLISQCLPDLAIDYPQDYTNWKAFLIKLSPTAPLPAMPISENQAVEQLLSGRNVISTYYQIQSQQERLRKHRIVAPYSGVLSETTIDPGTLVRAGQKLGTFVKVGGYELEAAVSKAELRYLQIGNKVQLHSDELNKDYVGTVTRINDIVSPSTQQVSVFLSVSGAELKEGIYLQATINGGSSKNAMKVDRKLIVDGEGLFCILPDSTLHLVPVEVIGYNGEDAIISGAPTNSLFSRKPILGAFEGMKVVPTLTSKKP